MALGDTMVTGSLPKVGGGGGFGGGAFNNAFGGTAFSKGLGGSIGGAVQPMQSQPSGGVTGTYQPPGIDPTTGQFSAGGVQYAGGGATVGAATTTQPYTASAPRDWYDSVGSSTRPSSSPVATPVSADPGGMLGTIPVNSQYDPNMLGLLGAQAAYQYGSQYAIQDNALNQQMLELKKRLLGIDNADVGIDKNGIMNRKNGLTTDSQFLTQQRGLYDQQLANQLAQIDTRHQLDRLDHENQYVSGGAWFAPGQKYRRDRIDAGAEQNRTDARLGTQMSQLGIDRSLAQNETQQRDYDFDMQKLDNRLAANGINLQMYGLNGQQLQMALQKKLDDLGIAQYMSATDLLNAASQGGTEQSDYALQMIQQWLQGGGYGSIQAGFGG